MAAFLTIGQVSASTGETRDTIRYYERLGLVPKPMRTQTGYRQYREGVVSRLGLIRNAQRFGFSLREIAGFLGVRDGGGKPCHDVRAAAGRMLEAVDRQIADLVATRKRMKTTLKTWDATLAATPADRPAFLLDSLAHSGRGGSQLSRKSAVPGGPVRSTVTDPPSGSARIARRKRDRRLAADGLVV